MFRMASSDVEQYTGIPMQQIAFPLGDGLFMDIRQTKLGVKMSLFRLDQNGRRCHVCRFSADVWNYMLSHQHAINRCMTQISNVIDS